LIIYSKSYTYAVIALNISPNPKVKIACRIANTGTKTKCQLIPTPYPMENNKIIIQEIKKLISPLSTIEIGNISRGK
jgi:hypothetical protein